MTSVPRITCSVKRGALHGGYPLGLRCMSRIREDTRSFTMNAFSWEKQEVNRSNHFESI